MRVGDEPPWSALPWHLSRAAEDAILAAKANVKLLADDLDLVVSAYRAYGKDFVKKCKVSPDAYVQMAMQLAYFKDQGRHDATYESSMTRLFLHGRTETIRPLTADAKAFVTAMLDPRATPADKLRALQAAAAHHVRTTMDAMSGNGIDRHLFALYVVSVGLKVDSPFLKGALGAPWKLSTSQQPQQQTNLWDIKDPKYEKKVSPGGGFGPVAEDGYGVSYMVSGERNFFFHVSSKRSHANTDSARFLRRIYEALDLMKEVLEQTMVEEKGGAAKASVEAVGAAAGAAAAATAHAEAAPAGAATPSKGGKRGKSKERGAKGDKA